MSVTMDDSIKRWTVTRKTALVVEIIQGKTTVAEASRAFDISPSEIEGWVDDAKRGMENALRANPLEIREQYEKQLKDLQEAYGEAMLELRARKKLAALMERGRQLIRTLHEGLLADRVAVPLALRLVRRAAADGLLQANQGRTAGRSPHCRADQGDDRKGAFVRLPDGGLASGLQQEHGSEDLPDQGLAGPQAPDRHAAQRRGDALGRDRAERTLVGRPVTGLGRARRLDHAGLGDRLPYPRTAGLTSVAIRQGHHRRQCPGACPHHPVRDLGQGARAFLLRSDNGLVFTSRRATALVRSYGLKQEFIMPHCPQQNGMVERVIFDSIQHATRAIGDWISFYNYPRPHQVHSTTCQTNNGSRSRRLRRRCT